MSKPKKTKTRHTKAKKVERKKISSPGWATTDADEIIRRQLRAQTEMINVKELDKDLSYYGSYLVYSDNWSKHETAKYLAEIRSLTTNTNSCSCLDFQTNGLGTCKHIERVLLIQQKRGKRKFKQAAAAGNPRTEIYLDSGQNQNIIKIQWRAKTKPSSKQYKAINKFFSHDNSLLGNALTTFPLLEQTVAELKPATKKHLRISVHINPWLERTQNKQQKGTIKTTLLADMDAGKYSLDSLKYPLYNYQQAGMLHLVCNERALLADEMGLGKTIQAIAACKFLQQTKDIKRVLVIATASLKAEWDEQIAKFSNLPTLTIYGSRKDRLQLYQKPAFFYLANYEQILYDGADIQRLIMPDVIILDEAQRIKNWQTKTAQAVKKLSSPYAFVLTGTPIENKIDDIYSIIQFLDPHLFGALFQFNRQYYCLDEKGRPVSYKNLDQLHRKLGPILLRRRKSDVEDQLPERTVNNYFVAMDEEQLVRYEEYNSRVAKLLQIAKRRPLRKEEFEKLQIWLACMRMLCDTPYILDQDCRISPKLHELAKILDEVLEDKTAKIIIFSEWEKMLVLIKELAQEMKLEYAWHTGSVPQHKRRQEINRFKESPHCRLFLSTDSGSVGLNLQSANIVINMDLPWNPAKLEQRIARAWRKHQHRTVQVINLVCENSIEHRMLSLLEQKKALAENILHEGKTKEMKMPSGRAAFMERLEAIMNTEQATATTTPSTDLQSETAEITPFKNDLIKYCQDNLQALEQHKGPTGKSTLFAIVKNNSSQTVQHMQQSIKNNSLDKSHDLFVLDNKTRDIIKQLADLGIITINQQNEKLFTSLAMTDSRKQQQKTRVEKAKKYLNQIERKYRMAKLLAEGGFYQEAITPLAETAKIAMASFAFVNHQLPDLNDSSYSFEDLQQCIEKNTDFPIELLNQTLILSTDDVNINAAHFEKRMKFTDTIIDFVEQTLNKLALS